MIYGGVLGGIFGGAIGVLLYLYLMRGTGWARKYERADVIDLATARLERKHRAASKRQAIEVVDEREGA